MDSLGVKTKSKNVGKRGKRSIKVVYISSPMKVTANASEFRALVQQLTGKDSDATRFMDANGGGHHMYDDNEVLVPKRRIVDEDPQQPVIFPFLSSYQEEEPSTSSDSVFESFDELFPPFEAGLTSLLQSSFFHGSSQLHVA
ncbi:hypothetical protein K2173_024773 [Erythroxylum novogranatense]|uniref:VQ domain-containing protein n=1 Tax=Erythroxylum novogranatense TaxID=1862640 RepID=A0AAV8SW42_9ROSI|nr:hypothetical protein K2173_024773 [Erythroxylum novogranatense]